MSICFVNSFPLCRECQLTGNGSASACKVSPMRNVQNRNIQIRNARVRMTASAEEPPKQEESIWQWLSKKIMHNFESDSYGYEPFFKEAFEAREEEMKKQYRENKDK